jgi:signal transduction histidine kinase
VEAAEPLLREKHHKIAVLSSYQLHVNGDQVRLVQCIGNLLNNAAKYTDPGGEIRVHLYADDGHAVVDVGDNGIGIAPELPPQIFTLFVQAYRSLDRSQGGLGIGLSVVKRLVEMHAGRIIARSDGVGRGSTFQIRLPLAERPRAIADSQHLRFGQSPNAC